MVSPATTLKRWALLSLAVVVLTSTGCLGTRRHTRNSDGTPKASESKAVELAVTCRKQVQYGVNPVNQEPVPAIACRLYLFDSTGGEPITADGKVEIELYDDTGRNLEKQSQLIERWLIDNNMLKQSMVRDAVGAGYSLTLPWSTYKPEITQIHLVVKYQPTSGTPLTKVSQVTSLEHAAPSAIPKAPGPANIETVIQASSK